MKMKWIALVLVLTCFSACKSRDVAFFTLGAAALATTAIILDDDGHHNPPPKPKPPRKHGR